MSALHSVVTDAAPQPAGPYSQAVVIGKTIYTAGQLGRDPKTKELVGPTTAEQTDGALKNLAAILHAAGSGLERVVKTTVYLADLADFAVMNEVYARHFGTHRPARATIQVGLPRGARVEIEAIAVQE